MKFPFNTMFSTIYLLLIIFFTPGYYTMNNDKSFYGQSEVSSRYMSHSDLHDFDDEVRLTESRPNFILEEFNLDQMIIPQIQTYLNKNFNKIEVDAYVDKIFNRIEDDLYITKIFQQIKENVHMHVAIQAYINRTFQHIDANYKDQEPIWNFGHTAWAQITKHGELRTGGDAIDGGEFELNTSKKVEMICATNSAFAAVLEDSSVIAFGQNYFGGKLPYPLKNIKKIFSTLEAFAALSHDGKICTWGNKDYGGKFPWVNLPKIKTIISNFGAFVAISEDNLIFPWGRSSFGGKVKSMKVKDIVATRLAFAAILENNSVFAFGNERYGGHIPVVQENVRQLFSNGGAFVALLQNENVYVWGDACYGGKIPETLRNKNVETILSTEKEFTAVLKNGKNITWGNIKKFECFDEKTRKSHHSASLDIALDKSDLPHPEKKKKMRRTSTVNFADEKIWNEGRSAWCRIRRDGTMKVEGDPERGGDCSHIQHELKDIKEIAATYSAFAVLRYDGRVFAWGNKFVGGKLDRKLEDVKQIYANDWAFVALFDNNSIFAWGHELYGGTIPVEIQEIVKNNVDDITPLDLGFKVTTRRPEKNYKWGHF